jgi:hypothetical protein
MHVLNRWAAWPRGIRWAAGGIAAAVLAAALAWALFVPAAHWLARHDVGSATGPLHETALDNARGRLLTLAAGLLAAGALIFTARTFYLSRQGQVTDRYTKAIEQLGSDKLEVRIGGIYALERVARDSARDHPVVMEVLTAFIREHSRERWPLPAPRRIARIIRWVRFRADERFMRIRPDVQAAVAVIGRRDAERDLRPVDLFGANLAGALLIGADFRGALISEGDLRTAVLSRSRLSRAIFTDSDLRDAFLDASHLRHANLTETDLRGADLDYSDLRDASLRRADLRGASLDETEFDGADLAGARWPEDAPVPDGWKRDASSGRLMAVGADSEPEAAT